MFCSSESQQAASRFSQKSPVTKTLHLHWDEHYHFSCKKVLEGRAGLVPGQ